MDCFSNAESTAKIVAKTSISVGTILASSGTVREAVASNTGGPGFVSSHWQTNLLSFFSVNR